MKGKIKRVLALIGAILLLGLYIATLIFALMDSPIAFTMFKICLYCTIAVPVLIYAMMLVYRLLINRNKELYGEKLESVIFDVGNVLVDYDWKKYLNSFGYDEETNDVIAKAMFLSPDWDEADRGALTPDQLLEKFISNAPKYEKEIRQVYENPGKTVTVFDYTKDWIKSLKDRGLKVYILSNYPQRTYEQTKDNQLDFVSLSDGALFSFQCKMLKPDKEIYDELIHKFNINPKRAVFIDDKAENIEGARKAGLQALRFTTFQDTSKVLDRLLATAGSQI